MMIEQVCHGDDFLCLIVGHDFKELALAMLKTCESDGVRVRFRFDHFIVGKVVGLYGAFIACFYIIGKNQCCLYG